MSTHLNHVEQTQGIIFSANETTDIGYESGTTVTPDYTVETNKLIGKLDWVQIDLGEDNYKLLKKGRFNYE